MYSEEKASKFFCGIEKLLSELLSKKSDQVHKTLKELYRLIQVNEIKVDNLSNFTQNEQDIVLSLIQYLISILSNPVFPVDSLLLSGTCLSILVADLFTPNYASIFLISLYFSMREQITDNYTRNIENKANIFEKNEKQVDLQDILSDCNLQNGSLSKKVQQITEEKCTSVNKLKVTFQQIAILHGILSYQNDELFLYKSPLFNDIPFLISLFDFIHLSCISPWASQYHAFSVLQSWLKVCEKHFAKILTNTGTLKTIFSSETKVITKLLFLLESNWESPIKGVSAFVKECYRLIISLSMSECKFLNLSNFNLNKLLIDQIMKLSWQVKGKYLVLSIILQFIDYKKFLHAHPELPKEVILNLRANYASSAVSEVYKSIVSAIKNYDSSEDYILSEWCKWWREPILNSLNSDDKSLIQNVINLVLPWSMKNIPKLYNFLLEDLTCKTNIFPQLILLRVAKESGICTLGEKEIKILQRYLHHQEIQIRSEILTILCCSPKKSEPLSTEELVLLKNFIIVNLNIDSTPFQQQFISQLRTLFVRIRDSSVQDYRLISKKSNLINYSQLEFIDWLAQTSLTNTYPGACFQRRRISLLILNNIFDVFIESVCGNRRKEKPSKLVEQIIHLAQSRNLWMFLTDDSLLKLLPCLTDFTDEIRFITFDLLVKYSKWPTVETKSTILTKEFISSSAEFLCNHPDYRSNDAGAHLYCLIFKKIYLSDGNVSDPDGYKQALTFICKIIESAKFQLHSSKQNFLIAASTYPLHGVLLALQYCLSNFKDTVKTMFQTEVDKTRNMLESTLNLCDDIIKYMLLIMKGNDETDNCPSFMSIGQALEKLIISQQSDLPIENKQQYPCEKSEKLTVKPNHSELELLLSCCWHSIKNSCSLLCELSSYYCKLELEMSEKEQRLKLIATILSSILISCRHRGVVDACSLSLNKFCTLLLENEVMHEEICKYLLNMVFESLSDAPSTSVTRRSAGLPSLCQAIVSSEKSNINRKLLSFTIKALLASVNQPLPSSTTISDKTDLPQAHAYHILKALVMEASLSQAILMHLDLIIPACVSGFSSELWAIRNGALQLFGVLLPRICGQKKVSDDESEYNLVSSSELFARCPSLEVYLLQQLRKCVKLHNKRKLSSELIPILSIIVKLSPPQDDDWKLFTDLKILLLELVDIPVWKIRDLVSSILSVIMTTEEILNQIKNIPSSLKNGKINCNVIHGKLCILQKCLKRNYNGLIKHHLVIMENTEEIYSYIAKLNCPILEGLILDIVLLLADKKETSAIILGNIQFNEKKSFNVGQVYYDNQLMLLNLNNINIKDIPEFIEQQIDKDISIQIDCFQFLTSKLHLEFKNSVSFNEANLENWRKIYVSVNTFIAPEKHPSVIKNALEFVIDLCTDGKTEFYILDTDVTSFLEKHLLHFLENDLSLSISALSLTMWSLIIKHSLKKCIDLRSALEKWTMFFSSFSQPRCPDILRKQAAYSLAVLGPHLVEYLSEQFTMEQETVFFILIGVFEGSLLLLQDEDEEIRNIACRFPSKINHEYEVGALQFNIGINVIFQHMYMLFYNNEKFLPYLWNKMQNYPSTVKILQSAEKSMKTNLFEQEYVNVFAEPIQILIKYKDLFQKSLEDLFNVDKTAWSDKTQMFLLDLKIELQDVLTLLSETENIQSNLNQGFAFPHQVFLAFKKLSCAVEILEFRKQFILMDTNLKSLQEEILHSWKCIENKLTFIDNWFLKQL